jgi:hypothetical protein
VAFALPALSRGRYGRAGMTPAPEWRPASTSINPSIRFRSRSLIVNRPIQLVSVQMGGTMTFLMSAYRCTLRKAHDRDCRRSCPRPNFTCTWRLPSIGPSRRSLASPVYESQNRRSALQVSANLRVCDLLVTQMSQRHIRSTLHLRF